MTALTSVQKILPLDELSSWAILGAGCGIAAAIPGLPPLASGLLLAFFAFVGPGSAVVDTWFAVLPTVAVRALVPVVSFSVVLLVISLSLMLGFWSPRVVLLALAAVTGAVGILQRRRSAPGEVRS